MDGGFSPPRILYTMRQPRSDVLLAECTKEWARKQVRAGAYPRQSIWYPGCCEGAGARPEIGDLFGPDPSWQPAKLLDFVSPDHLPEQR